MKSVAYFWYSNHSTNTSFKPDIVCNSLPPFPCVKKRAYLTNGAMPWNAVFWKSSFGFLSSNKDEGTFTQSPVFLHALGCAWETASFFLPTPCPLFYKGQWLPAHCILKAQTARVLQVWLEVLHSSLSFKFAAIELWLGNDLFFIPWKAFYILVF